MTKIQVLQRFEMGNDREPHFDSHEVPGTSFYVGDEGELNVFDGNIAVATYAQAYWIRAHKIDD